MGAHRTGNKQVQINGVVKLNSHRVWHENTGYWPDYKNKREVIHHLDGDSLNDAFENLQLMTTAEHNFIHSGGENSSGWQGDAASATAKYKRHWKYPDLYPPLTEEEKEEHRASRRAYLREYREKRRMK